MPARKTTLFEKIVLTPGEYGVVKNGKEREKDTFTIERNRKIVETGNRMIENGLKIPVPFFHFDKNGLLPKPVTLSENGEELDPITGEPIQWDASGNGGFVSSWELNDEGAAVANIESFGDPNDPNAPAGKLGTVVQETSLGLAAKYVDGKGIVYKDAPIHLAACIKAVEPGQTNFNLLDPGKVTGDLQLVSMSMQLSPITTMATAPLTGSSSNQNRPLDDEENEENRGENLVCDIPNLLNLLRKLENPIDVPGDTNIENLVERLCIAVNQQISAEENSSTVEPGEGNAKPKPPQGAQEKTGYQTMSQTPQTPAAPVQPTQTQVTPEKSQESVILMSMLGNSQKAALQARVEALKTKGVSQAWLDKHIVPLLNLDVTTMSLSDFDQATGKHRSFATAESLIAAMEDSNLQTMSLNGTVGYQGGMPNGAQELSYDDTAGLSEEDKKANQEFADMVAQGV